MRSLKTSNANSNWGECGAENLILNQFYLLCLHICYHPAGLYYYIKDINILILASTFVPGFFLIMKGLL